LGRPNPSEQAHPVFVDVSHDAGSDRQLPFSVETEGRPYPDLLRVRDDEGRVDQVVRVREARRPEVAHDEVGQVSPKQIEIALTAPLIERSERQSVASPPGRRRGTH